MALVVAATLVLVLTDEEYVAPPPTSDAVRIQPGAAATLLEDLTGALATGDPRLVADLAGDDVAARRQLSAVARNVDRIGLVDLDLRYVDELGGMDAEGRWSATAVLTWRIAEFDRTAASAEVRVDFRALPDDVVIAGVGGAGGLRPVWLDGPVQVRRTPDTLVVAARDADRYEELARRAVTVVRRVVPDWRSGLVIEVPRSSSALDAALDVERGTFANVAGVTAAADGSGADVAPVHVFLNPVEIDGLRPAGAQVVVSHEAAHVALDAPESVLPIWLSEGFADYVALRDVPLPLSTTAAQVIAQVRRDGPPDQLPDADDFDEQSRYFGAAYEAAWIACRMLADRVGERGLLRFYREADGTADLDRLFEQTFDTSLRTFTEEWRTTLTDLAE